MKQNIGYEIDFTEGKIIVSKKFLKDASTINTTAYTELVQIRKDYPEFTIVPRAITKKENKMTYGKLTYGTAFHEMIHSTGHVNRLNRLDATVHFGGEDYSKEELVAEIGSSALVHHCGLETQESFRNNTAYIQSWLSVLKNDKRFIVSASSKAEKAVRFILEGQ